MEESLKQSHQSQERDKTVHYPSLFNIVLKALAVAITQDKEIKGIQIRKEVKLPLFLNDIILYVWDPKNYTRKLLEIINKYSSVAGCSIHLHRSIAFLYINNKQRKIMASFRFKKLQRKENI